MKGSSKIARFPRKIRDELNRRIDDGEPDQRLIDWLNSLPEVQAILKDDFEGQPVNSPNFIGWKKSGFANWKLSQTALDFTEDAPLDDLDQDTLEKMSTKIIRRLQLRYAAVAGSLPPPAEDPQAELTLLASLCANLNAMRRGDLSAGRLAVEQQRLAIEKSRADDQMEKQFWEWTSRPDIHAKLYPHQDKEKIRRQVERMLNRRLLGIRDPDEIDEHSDPACLI